MTADKPPFVLALTGSIGMGKSTTAAMFREQGVPVWDADATVHALYGKNGAAVDGIRRICPEAVTKNDVDRSKLRDWIARDPKAIAEIEAIVHPLVAQDRQEFITKAQKSGADLVVVDVPLLFETGGQAKVDAVLVVSVSPDLQRARVLQRDDMTEDHFRRILAKQMPDGEKRKRADFVIETTSLQSARAGVERVLNAIANKGVNHA